MLMVRDPLKLNEQDIDQLIAHYRSLRHTYNSAPAAAPVKLTAKEKATEGLNLGGLDL
jgi:cytochrome c553